MEKLTLPPWHSTRSSGAGRRGRKAVQARISSAQPAPLERVLCHGGKVSFSFYLLHMGLLHLLARRIGLVHPTGNGWLDAAIMVAVCYGATWALATLSYNSIEEPFLRMRRRYGQEKPARSSAVLD
jgi:peptidoglycan/LPS O-acetylase OafA/YrhL